MIFVTLFVFTLGGCSALYKHFGWNSDTRNPAGLKAVVANDDSLQAMLKDAFRGLENGEYVDHHVHVVGLAHHKDNFHQEVIYSRNPEKKTLTCGDNGSDMANELNQYWLFINKKRFTVSKPYRWFQTKVLMQSSGIDTNIDDNESKTKANMQYAEQLYQMVKHFRPDETKNETKDPGTFILLPLDAYYKKDKSIDWVNTDIYIPNEYVLRLAKCLNNRYKTERNKDHEPFEAAISLHPYQKDVLEKLKDSRDEGVRYVKWLPNTMNIDPGHKDSIAFYQKMKELGMVLISHSGHEEATVALKENQKYGNPFLFDKAIASGMNLIMAHSGYRGFHKSSGKKSPNTEAFQSIYDGSQNVYGGLSAVFFFKSKTQIGVEDDEFVRDQYCINKKDSNGQSYDYMKEEDCLLKENVEWIFERESKNPGKTRFVNGSDYPLPISNYVNPVKTLYKYGFITGQQSHHLETIYQYNPLLFDFLLKRIAIHPENKNRLPLHYFKSLPGLN